MPRFLPEPLLVVDVDLDTAHVAYPPGRDPRRYRRAWAVLRRAGVPVGVAEFELADGVLHPSAVGSEVASAAVSSAAVASAAGRQQPTAESEPSTPGPAEPGGPDQAASPLPRLTVVICTVSRPAALRRTVASVAMLGEVAEIVVVDNSIAGVNAGLLAELAREIPQVRTAHEPVPGVSRARNRGAALATGEVIAFTDDDVVVEAGWARALASAAADHDVATGLILPAELDTPAQVWCQRAGGHGKGFTARTFCLSAPNMSPLFPYQVGAYGSAANMAVRRPSLQRLGGFDEDLGAGTPTRGGEELDLFLRAVLAGMTVRYTPAAVVRHHDLRSREEFTAQRYAYGVGLSAVLAKHARAGAARQLGRRALPGAWYLLSPWSPKNRGKRTGYPISLTATELLGVLRGPSAHRAAVAR